MGPAHPVQPGIAAVKSAVSTVIVFTAMGAWNSFLWPSIVVNETEMFTIPIAVTRFYSEFRWIGVRSWPLPRWPVLS